MRKFMVILLLSSFISQSAFAWGGGYAQIPYLIRIITENVKRYQQLREMIRNARDRERFIKAINAGIENSIGLIESLPIKDESILGELKEFKKAYKLLQDLYGVIPKTQDAARQMLHDQTVAEALKVVAVLQDYATREEKNAKKIFYQARNASPKGAQRMTAQVNAKILHTLNQLLKVNGQILKLQSEQLAITNKSSKDESSHYKSVTNALSRGLNNFNGDFNLPKF